MAYGTSTTNTPGSTLNLRIQPSTGSTVLSSIPHGGALTITGAPQNGWYPVTVNGQTGYVSAQYVAPFTPTPTAGTPGTTPTPTPTPTGPYGSSTTNTPGSTLNFRQSPSTTSAVLGSIPNGGAITLTGAATNGWFPATFNGQTGYVSSQYVNPFTPSTPGTGTPPATPPAAPPAAIPHTPSNPNTPSGSNPFYNPGSTYGGSQNWYNTPLVSQTQDFDAEWEKRITDQGFGGTTTKSNIARNLIDRAKSGFNAATMNNPNMTARNYLDTLGPNFVRDRIASMTPGQRGEMHSIYRPSARWTPR